MRYTCFLLTVLFVQLQAGFFRLSAQTQATYLFTGSYTGGKPGNGIHVFRFDTETGSLRKVSTVGHLTNSSWITLSPDGRNLYACTDTKLPREGTVKAFAFDPAKGRLSLLNSQPGGGENPVYIAMHPSGGGLVNVNYTGGSVSAFPLSEDGSLLPASQHIQFEGSGLYPDRQEASHPHAAVFSPDQRYVFIPDLGTDLIRVFDWATDPPMIDAKPSTVVTLPGSGPRHLTFHPNGRFAYCIEELSGCISVYQYHDGRLDSIQRVFSYSKTQEVYNSADIHLSPDGHFLYASNRWDGENTLSIWAVDTTNGLLTFVAHQSTLGDHPRNFCIDPTGSFLLVANQVSGTIVVFRRDTLTGLLSPTGKVAKLPSPSCLQMFSFPSSR